MSFNSIVFLFLFLPISLIVYYVCPKRFRAIPLILASLLFYAWGNPFHAVVLLFSVLFNYITGLEIDHARSGGKPGFARFCMIAGVVVNLLLLGLYKYTGFLVDNINLALDISLKAPDLSLPAGLSFFTFTSLSYILDVYLKKADAEKNFLDVCVYITFFPKLVEGPIVRFRDIHAQLKERSFDMQRFTGGVCLFIIGLAKKLLLADSLAVAFTAISGMDTMSAGTAWLGMIFYSLELYFDFSGYSAMAIGLAALFGFDFDKNFDYPYTSKTITEFWRRWHISLGGWFREYVYIPLGGNRGTKGQLFRNLLIVWLLTGLWHGADWTFIIWGLWHGAFAILERFVIKDKFDRVPGFLRVLATVLIVFLGWVWFFSPNLTSALHYFGQMLGQGGLGFMDSTARYYLGSNLPLLVLSVLGCGPLVKSIHDRLAYTKNDKLSIVSALLLILMLVLCVGCMVSSTYSTFLYAQF